MSPLSNIDDPYLNQDFERAHQREIERTPPVSRGRLAQVSDHRLELRFAGSNAAMHVDMLGREEEDLEKMAQALSKNADLTLDICVVKKKC